MNRKEMYPSFIMIISLIGLENQTKAERLMPVRVIGYDGAAYRAQLLDKGTKRVYPVLTIVLYFGKERWNYSHKLTDVVDIPQKFKTYISDYEMKNLFEISFLEKEQIQMFRSDFRYVAEYFVQTRTNQTYKPEPGILNHVDAMFKLLSILTGDRRFADVAVELPEKGVKMSEEVLDVIENRGIEKGRIEGRNEGRIEGRKEGKIEVLYTMFHYSPERIAEELNEPVNFVRHVIEDIPNDK
ncbi:MAG: Rpn family recombination-promoting nuclease/putative transposase [Bilifractor sp.]